MKYFRALPLLLSLAIGGCGFVQGMKDEAEQKTTDTSKMTPTQAFEVNAGHMLAALGIITIGTLTHGLVNAGTIKDLVTSIDTSVPSDVHAQSIQGLAQSVPVTTPAPVAPVPLVVPDKT